MAKFLTTVVLHLAAFSVHAQLDTALIRTRYEAEVIRYRVFGYIKGNTEHPRKDLKYEFENSHEGKQMYKLQKVYRAKSRISLPIGIASIAGSLYAGTHQRPVLSRILEAGLYVSAGFSLHFKIQADKKLRYAVWVRNRDALLAE